MCEVVIILVKMDDIVSRSNYYLISIVSTILLGIHVVCTIYALYQ